MFLTIAAVVIGIGTIVGTEVTPEIGTEMTPEIGACYRMGNVKFAKVLAYNKDTTVVKIDTIFSSGPYKLDTFNYIYKKEGNCLGYEYQKKYFNNQKDHTEFLYKLSKKIRKCGLVEKFYNCKETNE